MTDGGSVSQTEEESGVRIPVTAEKAETQDKTEAEQGADQSNKDTTESISYLRKVIESYAESTNSLFGAMIGAGVATLASTLGVGGGIILIVLGVVGVFAISYLRDDIDY